MFWLLGYNGAVKPMEDALKSIMTEKVGILRDAAGLQEYYNGYLDG